MKYQLRQLARYLIEDSINAKPLPFSILHDTLLKCILFVQSIHASLRDVYFPFQSVVTY